MAAGHGHQSLLPGKTPLTAKWFAATKDVSPLKGVINLGYDRAASGTLELSPLDTVLDDQSTLKFSGLNLEVSASAEAQKVKANGYMDSLTLTSVAEDQSPVKVELNGLTLASNLTKSSFGYYLGDNTVEISSSKTTFGDKQAVLNLKKLEMKTATSESGTNAAGRADYKIAEITLNDKALGSAKMAWSMKTSTSRRHCRWCRSTKPNCSRTKRPPPQPLQQGNRCRSWN